jgi:hypothetical protein
MTACLTELFAWVVTCRQCTWSAMMSISSGCTSPPCQALNQASASAKAAAHSAIGRCVSSSAKMEYLHAWGCVSPCWLWWLDHAKDTAPLTKLCREPH